jgi:UDPglucose 6-dehydrogenase/GDP-mannose 6-dehydrogenase
MSICVERSRGRLSLLQIGKAHFFEPGLDELFERVQANGQFSATDDLDAALADSDVVIIAVGTPSTDLGIDLTDVCQVATDIGRRLKSLDRYLVVAVKSTVVPGSTDGPVREAVEAASGMKLGAFGLAMNPEFLREGCAVMDFLHPDRIVIGASDDRAGDVLENLHRAYNCPILRTSLRNAEMIKYSSNALLACLISFSNEISRTCELIEGVDEETVMQGLHLDKRMWVAGSNGERLQPELLTYLRGGVGYGGSCFPKDVRAFERFAESLGLTPHLITATRHINDARASDIVNLLESNLSGSVAKRRIAVLGLAFKPDTDDIRESAGLRIAVELVRRGANVIAHDPMVTEEVLMRTSLPKISLAPSLGVALTGSDAAIIATSWAEYRNADWTSLTKDMAVPIVLDGRQVIPQAQRGRGFIYGRIGQRGTVGP